MEYVNNKKTLFYLCIGILVLMNGTSANSIPVFPGAQGYGTQTRAAYGASNNPIICIVTTTGTSGGSPASSTRNGVAVKTGSLRSCIEYAPPSNTGKVILFEVSGIIYSKNDPYKYKISHPYTTVAGQTAPSPGILLRNISIQVTTHDVLVQHIRSRIGEDLDGVDPGSRNNFTVVSTNGDVYNVVMDHLSASWGTDVSVLFAYKETGTCSDITWSNTIISEGLDWSIHPKSNPPTDPEIPHGFNGAIQQNTSRVSLIRNLFAHSRNRNPYVRSSEAVIVNNLLYNIREIGTNIYASTSYGPVKVAAVGNYVKEGPESGDIGLMFPSLNRIDKWYRQGEESKIYLLQNKTKYGVQINSTDWSMVDHRRGDDYISRLKVTGENYATDAPLWPSGLEPIDVNNVEETILHNVGARPADRDDVDKRVIDDIIHRSGRIINSPDEVGGYPNLPVNTLMLDIPANPHADDDGDGYTNLEEWIHSYSKKVEQVIQNPIDNEVIDYQSE